MSQGTVGSEPTPEKVRPGYLVLGRRQGERIILTLPNGDEISITAVKCRGDYMRIGVSAPPSVAIDREELIR